MNDDLIPRYWYNIAPDMPRPVPPPIDPLDSGLSLVDRLKEILPHHLIDQEFSFERYIEIPEEVRKIYREIRRQTPLLRARKLEEMGLGIAGTRGTSIDIAEDRAKFSSLLDRLGIDQPAWARAISIEDSLKAAGEIGYPVIVRPSYVLSGTSIAIAYNDQELALYLEKAAIVSREHSVTISRFIENGIEAEIDAVADGRGRVIGVAIEHIERAGVHSGDAIMVIPPRRLDRGIVARMREIAVTLANELSIKGPYNIQFIAKEGRVYVIELNLRASRSMPFSSKAKGVNLAEAAVKATIGPGLKIEGEFWEPESRAWAVKTPQFSWARVRGAYPFLGPEMRSTVSVASLG